MINAASAFAAEARVHRSDPEMLKKRRVIGARSERSNPQVRSSALFRILAGGARLAPRAPLLHSFPYGSRRVRLLNVACDFVDQSLERMRCAGAQPAFACAVRV